MIDSSAWTATFDRTIAFRRFVRGRFSLPVRAELKANYLLRNGGPLRARPLSERARHDLYRAHMRLQPKLGMTTFAVVTISPARSRNSAAVARPLTSRGSTCCNAWSGGRTTRTPRSS
jgi:hypothetical protein